VDVFKAHFADTATEEQAYGELSGLTMQKDEIDDYIATFEYLLARAGWERNARGTLEMFKQGLRKGLHWTIIQRDPIPQDLDRWQAATRREVQRRRLALASLGPRGGDHLSTRENRRREPFRGPPRRQSQRDPDAMDVDMITIGRTETSSNQDQRGKGPALSKEERQKRFAEGRCFGCGKQGHLSKACLTKKSGGTGRGRRSGNNERRTHVINAQTEEQNSQNEERGEGSSRAPDTAPAYDPASIIDYMKNLSQEDRDAFLDGMMANDVGF
jgi:hypothetical protein